MAMDYNKTINLPQTDFPMRAGLPKREPEMLAQWKKIEQKKLIYSSNTKEEEKYTDAECFSDDGEEKEKEKGEGGKGALHPPPCPFLFFLLFQAGKKISQDEKHAWEGVY